MRDAQQNKQDRGTRVLASTMLPIRETFEEAELTGACGHKYKVLNVYTKKGTNVFPRRRLCEIVSEAGQRTIIKAKSSGVVTQILVSVGDSIADGCEIVEVEACGHTALMGNICCDCGILLREEDLPKTEAVSMLHSVPDLKISRGEAQKLGQEDIRNLLKQQKLVLLVDLDQTLIHTTNDNIPANLKDVYHFQLTAGGPWYHARIRPHTKSFLENISKYYELHISTFGVREYAHHIAHFLDPDHKLFGQRILSRNECLNLMSKKANIDSLFPCGDNMVCIIDDRTDVWNFSPNVVQVAPYHFFRHTGDINAPQGLQKKERDDCDGIDFKNLKKEIIKPVVSPEEKKENKEVCSSDSNADETQPPPQSSPTRQQGAGEVIGDGERGTLSDTKSNEDSGNYSGSDDSWESSPEAQESSPEGQELSIEMKAVPENQELSVEMKATPENQESNSETQESNAGEETDSKPQKKCLEAQNSSTEFQESAQEKKEECPDENCESVVQETNSSSPELNPESQQPSSETEKLSSEEQRSSTGTLKETKDAECSKESENHIEQISVSEKTDKDQHAQQSLLKESENQLVQTQIQPISQQQVFDVVDNDDYLLYLEDILKKIHKVFFSEYEASLGEQEEDQKLSKEHIAGQKGATLDMKPLPDLKKIVPAVKKKVLRNVSLVFSGVVPQQVKLKDSKAYLIATSFGATVSDKLVVRGEAGIPTTHLVAANRHTEKVNAARKMKSIKIVTPNWLWKCTERWERVEERLFPLTKETEKEVQRVPPLHCSNPDAAWFRPSDLSDSEVPRRMRTPSGSLLQDINPLIYLSPDDMNNMEDEVEKILSDGNDSEGESESEASEDNSDSNDMEEGGDDDDDDDEDDDGEPKKKKRRSNDFGDEEDENEDELPSVTFRQGGQLPSDDSNSEDDDDDEGDLRRMGADLESLLN